MSGWQQRLDLHMGVISTTATWIAPDGHVTDLRYAVFTQRAHLIKTLRASSYDLLVSTDGTHWTTAAQVSGKTQGTQDELTFQPACARYVRVQIIAATYGRPPMLEEITVPGGKHP